MKKLSVVVSAFNSQDLLDDCLKSVKGLADEIIVVDNSSTDKTSEIAKKYTDKVYTRENNLMLNINKNFGISKASGEWVLLLDADERVTDELRSEIGALVTSEEDSNGYSMPRKNIIFGKWIEHTGWYPDRQLRLFKNGKAKFAERHVHEMIDVDGSVGELEHPLYHLNYTSVSQFLDKMVRVYTISEADYLIDSGYKIKISDSILMPTNEFVKRFFAEKGFKDGSHGLMLSLLMAFYHFIVFLRVWEKKSYPDSNDVLSDFGSSFKESNRQINHWVAESTNSKNPIKKLSNKILQKIG